MKIAKFIITEKMDISAFVVPNSAMSFADFYGTGQEYCAQSWRSNGIHSMRMDEEKFVQVWLHDSSHDNLVDHGCAVSDDTGNTYAGRLWGYVPAKLLTHAKEGDEIDLVIPMPLYAINGDDENTEDTIVLVPCRMLCKQHGYRYDYGSFEDLVKKVLE